MSAFGSEPGARRPAGEGGDHSFGVMGLECAADDAGAWLAVEFLRTHC
jgi:hypothetical protein